MPSVVIAAHNEEAVIGECLAALREQKGVESLEVIVSVNGSTDQTANIARRAGATVLDLAEAGKSNALNAADRVATTFPRIYLDADIVPPSNAIAALIARLAREDGTIAAVPQRMLATSESSWPVRAYFAINERLPVFRNGLFGRGMIAISEMGRSRFAEFPLMVADDLFLDSQFADAEKTEVSEVQVFVDAPRSTRALVTRLVRVRRGNADMRQALGDRVRPSDRWAWLRDVVIPQPLLVGAAVPYVLITVAAGLLARRASAATQWGRDDSTRTPTQNPTPRSPR